ncbi:MAG TPA: glycosyl hydrolase family 8 [Polyangiaceae bacterium]
MTNSTVRRTAPAALVLSSIFVAAPALAQNHPFPTAAHYAQGFVPSAVTTAVVQSSYANWKSKYLLGDCGSGAYRVDNALGDGSTFSEGQGYGMVLTAYFGDKAQFDGLWSFAQKNYGGGGLMGWHVTCGGPTSSDGGDNSATDGDTDIGFALIVAAAQWGGTYAQQAKTYLATLKSVDFETCPTTGRILANAGSWQSGTDACSGGSNTSYWMPGYYRVFAAFTGDAFWTKAADDAVTLYGLGANSTTGIIVNELDENGMPIQGETYDYNSCRIPWRDVLDYLWFGTAGAKQTAAKLTTWANGVGVGNLVDGYNADGTPTGTNPEMNAFVGGFAAGAMASSQSIVDAFATNFVGIDDDNGTYYGASLRTLYLLTLSGNEWNPLESATDGGTGGGSGGSGSSGSSSGAGSGSGGSGGSSGGASSGSGSSSGASAEGDAGNGASSGGSGSSGGCGCSSAPGDVPAWAVGGLLVPLALFGRRSRGRARKGDR